MPAQRLFLLTGGGTAGHVYPALAIAEALSAKDPSARFIYVGTNKGAEAEIVPKYPALVKKRDLHFIDAKGFPVRWLSLATISFCLSLFKGTFQAIKLLRQKRPSLVIGTGGYVSAPSILAAYLLSIPVLLNEQNAQPGKVNRWLGKLAQTVVVSFESTKSFFPKNGVWTGYPVRAAIRQAALKSSEEAKREVLAELKIDPAKKIVLITGGSLGARSINRCVVEALSQLNREADFSTALFFIHGVGRNESTYYHAWQDTMTWLEKHGLTLQKVESIYRAKRYLFDLEKYYQAADVIVCRGGAGSIAEAVAFGKPLLVIPKSGLPGNHQERNAQALAQNGLCRVLLEQPAGKDRIDRVDPQIFLEQIHQLCSLSDSEKDAIRQQARQHFNPDCLENILVQFNKPTSYI